MPACLDCRRCGGQCHSNPYSPTSSPACAKAGFPTNRPSPKASSCACSKSWAAHENALLDVCCWNRPFDDQTQNRIHLEAEAVLAIVAEIKRGHWQLISSEVIDLEID